VLEVLFDPSGLPFWIMIGSILAIVVAWLMRPLLLFAKFVYPNAKFEAMGNPFVSEKNISALVESKSLDSFIEQLNAANKDYSVNGDSAVEVQRSLDDSFVATVEMMKKDSSPKMHPFFDVYLESLDVAVLKIELKKVLLNRAKEISSESAILSKTKNFLESLKIAESENIAEIVKRFGLSEEVVLALEKGRDGLEDLDVGLDRFRVDLIRSVKMPYKCDQPRMLLADMLSDMLNIRSILRGKQLGLSAEQAMKNRVGSGREFADWKLDELCRLESVPQVVAALEGSSWYVGLRDAMDQYNSQGSVQVFEDALDKMYLRHIHELGVQNYLGVGPTFRFLVGREFETRNLKIIAKGVFEGLSADRMKKLLVLEEVR